MKQQLRGLWLALSLLTALCVGCGSSSSSDKADTSDGANSGDLIADTQVDDDIPRFDLALPDSVDLQQPDSNDLLVSDLELDGVTPDAELGDQPGDVAADGEADQTSDVAADLEPDQASDAGGDEMPSGDVSPDDLTDATESDLPLADLAGESDLDAQGGPDDADGTEPSDAGDTSDDTSVEDSGDFLGGLDLTGILTANLTTLRLAVSSCNESATTQPQEFLTYQFADLIVSAPPADIGGGLLRFGVTDAKAHNDGARGATVVISQADFTTLFGSDLASLKVGDEIFIVGRHQEYFCHMQIRVDLAQPGHTILRAPVSDTPSPGIVLDSCFRMVDRDPQFPVFNQFGELYEGMVITLTNVSVTDNSLEFGQIELMTEDGTVCRLDDDYRLWTNDGVGVPQTDPNKPGVTWPFYNSITGIVIYSFGLNRLVPYSLDNLVVECNDGQKNGGESDVDCGRTVWFNEVDRWREQPTQNFEYLSRVEIAGPAGLSLNGWTLEVHYYKKDVNNNPPEVYHRESFGLTGTLSGSVQNGIGVYATNKLLALALPIFDRPFGWALIDPSGKLVQFISHNGTLKGPDGATKGVTSQDIGLTIDTVNPGSARLIGGGSDYKQFSWTIGTDSSFGTRNPTQSFRLMCGACDSNKLCRLGLDCKSGACSVKFQDRCD